MNPKTDPTGVAILQHAGQILTLTWRSPRAVAVPFGTPTLALLAIADVRRRDNPAILGAVGYREHAGLPLFVATSFASEGAGPDSFYTDDLAAAAAHAAGPLAPDSAGADTMYTLIATRTSSQFRIITGHRILTPDQRAALVREWAQWLSEQPHQGAWGTQWGECFHAFVRAGSTAAGWDGPTYIAWLLNVSRYDGGPVRLQDLADQGYSVGQPEPGDEEN